MKRTKYYKVVKLNAHDGGYYSAYLCGRCNNSPISRKKGRVKVISFDSPKNIEQAEKFLLKYSLFHKTKPIVDGTSIFAFTTLSKARTFSTDEGDFRILEGYGTPSQKKIKGFKILFSAEECIAFWERWNKDSLIDGIFSELPEDTILLDDFTPTKLIL